MGCKLRLKSRDQRNVATAKLHKGGSTIFGNGKVVLHTNPAPPACRPDQSRKVTLGVARALIKDGKGERCKTCWTLGEWANTMKVVKKIKPGEGLQQWM